MQLLETLRIKLARIGVPDDWREGLDNVVVEGIARQVAEGRPVNPVRVDDQYQLVQGRHRLAGHFNAGSDDVLVQVVSYDTAAEREEDTLLENLCRRTLTPDERDRGLRRLWELSEPANDDADADGKQSAKAPRKTKGERASDLAAKTGISQRTVERAVREPKEFPEPIVPKPPTMDKLFQRAHELLCEAQSILEPIKADIEALRGDFDKKDGRWALLGCVAQAANEARLGAEYVAQARGFREAMERAKHTKGGNKRPVGAFDVVKGQDMYQASSHKRAPDPDAMAQDQRWRHKNEEEEARLRKESLRLASERSAGPTPPLGLSDPPKVGLKVPKRVQVVDEQDRPLLPTAEETANAWADAARMGVGPSDDGDAF